ncbi:MAG: SRPBCC domain-containing protein [Anaerolineae bacterium]|nr:SRPBCC domain-containing protein [Anaerolineae bacterium]
MKRDLRYERFLKHPPTRVWRALTEPEALARWFMSNDFQPVVGHRFTLRTDPGPTFDGVLHGEVTLVDEPHRLAYTFRGGMMRYETLVTWTLTPQQDGTLLTLDHTGFTDLPDVIVSFIIGSGWRKFLAQLPAVLDTLDA